MNKAFSEAEKYILSLFKEKNTFNYNDQRYEVTIAGKPTCSNGEPKTDIFVLATNILTNDKVDFKISFKKDNADFLENKIRSERACQIFGHQWDNILINSICSIEDKFLSKKLIYKEKQGKTEKGCITLGWKFELLNKLSGQLSGKMKLSKKELKDVYAGVNLEDGKKHAFIGTTQINNSGVANFLLHTNINEIKSIQDIIDNIVSIDDYIEKNPDIYFACKALNYRTFKDKWDGDRPLCVFINWNVINNKLHPTIVFNNPLNVKGNEVAEKLKSSLNKLNINTTDDINQFNISDTKYLNE